jgi:hypothetical protein
MGGLLFIRQVGIDDLQILEKRLSAHETYARSCRFTHRKLQLFAS